MLASVEGGSVATGAGDAAAVSVTAAVVAAGAQAVNKKRAKQ
jgi:hypothetical protein